MNRLKGSFFLLLATVIWGSAFVSQSIAANYIGAFTFQTLRCILGALAMLPAVFLRDRKINDGKSALSRWLDPTLWKAGLFCGTSLFFASNLQQLGLAETGAGKSGFLTAMYIVIVPVLGIFRKKKPTLMIPVSVAVAVVGLYLLSCAGVTAVSIGDLLLIGCAFLFAVQITMVDIYAPYVDALRLNALQALVCSVLSGIVMLFTETPTVQGITSSFLPLLHTGILSMGVAYYLQIIGQRFLEAAPAALIMSLESVFALLFGIIFLQETMTAPEIWGSTLIFAAVILSQIPFPLGKK